MTTTERPAERPASQLSGVDRFFSISQRGSTVRREVRGGVVTFFTMAYIVVLNPLIVGTARDADGTVLGIPKVAAATALVAAVMTVAMGVVGRYPFAIATGLGLNAFLAVAVASRMSWPDAMGLVVCEGVIITVLVLTGFRSAVVHAIPAQLKTSIGVGIGLFIALIGLVDAGVVRRIPDAAGTTVPVQLGTGTLRGWPVLVFVVGLLLMAALMALRVRGALLIGIVVTAVLAIVVEAIVHAGPAIDAAGVHPEGWQLNVPKLPDKVADTPDLSLLGHFSLFGGFDRIGILAAALVVFTIMLSDFFDTMGTVVAVAAEGDLLDEDGELPGMSRVLLVDSVAAAAGGAASTSSNTTYIESASGVGDGARTGLASVVTGLLFVVALFLTPLVAVVPSEAAAPALVVVGALMLAQVKNLDLEDFSNAIPAFLTIVLMPFTYSITVGIGAGVISYVVLRTVRGRGREIHPLLWVVAAAFVLYFAIDPIKTLLGVS
jgi:AGZA family xanthine/uracil permease-like MFS transporter